MISTLSHQPAAEKETTIWNYIYPESPASCRGDNHLKLCIPWVTSQLQRRRQPFRITYTPSHQPAAEKETTIWNYISNCVGVHNQFCMYYDVAAFHNYGKLLSNRIWTHASMVTYCQRFLTTSVYFTWLTTWAFVAGIWDFKKWMEPLKDTTQNTYICSIFTQNFISASCSYQTNA